MRLRCLIWLLSAPAIRLLHLILNYWAQTDASEIATSSNEFLSTPSARQSDKRPAIILPEKNQSFFPTHDTPSLSELNSSFPSPSPRGGQAGSASPRAVRVASGPPPSSRTRISGQRWIGVRGGHWNSAFDWSAFVGSEGRRRVFGLMLGARESAQVLILASLESRDSLGFLSWAFKFSSWFCLPLGTYGGNGVKIWSYSCFYWFVCEPEIIWWPFLRLHCYTSFANCVLKFDSGNQLCALDGFTLISCGRLALKKKLRVNLRFPEFLLLILKLMEVWSLRQFKTGLLIPSSSALVQSSCSW